MKRKRSRMSVRIYQKFEDNSSSNTFESNIVTNSVIKNSYHKLKRRKSGTETSILKNHLLMSRKERAFEPEEEVDSELNDSITKSLHLMPSKNRNPKSGATKKQNICNIDTSSKKGEVERKESEKLLKVNDKQTYCKRKFQEEMVTIIEKKVEKRKKLLCLEPKNKTNIQSNENVSKINHSIHSKSNFNLLDYFSKTTSEQLETERLKKTRVTIKAEIHSSQGLQTSDLLDNNQKQKIFKPKEQSYSKKIIEEYDEIHLVQSETVVLSSNDKISTPSLQQNKPKWSLKIQLQSSSLEEPGIGDERYMPTALSEQLKENLKNDKDIPKILLPMKNRKIGWNKLPSLMDVNKEKKSSKNLKTKNEENKAILIETSETNLNFKIKKNNNFCTESEMRSNSFILSEKSASKKTSIQKLAPLFLKKLKPNTENIATNHSFLQSESNKLIDNTKTNNIKLMLQHILPYPKISHINQITLDVDDIITLNQINKTYNFSEKKVFQPAFNYSAIKTVTKLKNYDLISNEVYEFIKADISFVLAELRTYYPDVQNLWEYISKRSVRSMRLKTKQKMSSNLNNFSQFSYLWTDKYKPNNSQEVVGNEAAALKLKNWLQNWQSLKNNENYSSSEEFYISDNSSSSDMCINKVAILIGPHGSGKTASVYAVAQELGYTVLEVNASSKRPGKKILKEFEEATKSHRVKNFDLENPFAVSSCKIENNADISKNSLIFLEDIDLIFEEDDGFVSATFQLASNTRRPIVMTLRNTCLHLPKLAPQQLQINFKPIVGKKVIVLLQLIALAETGHQLSQSCIEALCQDGDLRKSLLQLQYLSISGRQHILHASLAVNDLSWKNMETYIYKPIIKADTIRRKQHNHETINTLVNHLDNFTLVSNLMNIKNPICTSTNIKCEPSISLIQNTLPYCSLDNVSLEIGNWIDYSIKNTASYIGKERTNQPTGENETFYSLSREEQIIHINSILSKVALSSLDHQSIATDYLPSIRNICRAEKVRNQINSKRGNRFFHYLQNSILSTGTMKTSHIFSAACKMLEEKIL